MTALGKLFRTTTFKLTLVYLTVFALFAAFLLGYFALNTRRLITEQITETVDAEVTGLSEQYRIGGIRRLVIAVDSRARRPGSSLYLVTTFAGEALAGNITSLPPGTLDRAGWVETAYRRLDETEGPGHPEHYALARVFQLSGGFRILVGRDLDERERLYHIVTSAGRWSIAMVIVLGLAGGLFVTRRVLRRVGERGWRDDTDVIFTTDHGELQGDFGLVFKGPFHTDALMRLPMIWQPAPVAGVEPCAVGEPVGQLDLAPTFCEIAGVPVPAWMEGAPLPIAAGSGRERVLCEWDSQFPGYGMHLRTIYRDGWLCTTYERSTVGEPNGLEEFFASTGMFGGGIGPVSPIAYDGTEGELYNVHDDPHQFVNRWDDPDYEQVRADLVADLYDNLPEERTHLKVVAPA